MSENPYQPPASAPPELEPPWASLEELVRLRGVARSLLRVLLCIPVQLVMFADLHFSPAFLEVAFLVVILVSLCFTVQLVNRLKGWLAALAVGLFVPFPGVGSLVFIVVSASTGFVLRRAGFKVGLFGADTRQIQKAIDALERPAA